MVSLSQKWLFLAQYPKGSKCAKLPRMANVFVVGTIWLDPFEAKFDSLPFPPPTKHYVVLGESAINIAQECPFLNH